jgi:hypothetical protein
VSADILNRAANFLFSKVTGFLMIGGILLLSFASNDALLATIPLAIDTYQFTIILFLFILTPLSFIRRIRPYIQHSFILVRTVLFLCLYCFSLITVYASWGKFYAILCSFFFICGVIFTSIFNLIYTGSWMSLAHVIIMLVAIYLCIVAESKINDYADKK